MFPTSRRWDPSRGSMWPASRVQIWSMSRLVAETDDFIAGKVTERRVNGLRSSIDLTVPATARWRRWLKLPGLELLPFSGFRWGTAEELLPLGVFPILPTVVPEDATSIALHGDDHWQYVKSGDFTRARQAYPGLIRDVIGQLLFELGIGAGRIHPVTKDRVGIPSITATSAAVMDTSIIWEHRNETVLDLADSISAEVFIDRYGRPVVQDQHTEPGRDLTDGEQGTVISLNPTADWADVVNAVAVSSSNTTAPAFDQVEVGITDMSHPAHSSRIGPRLLRVSSNTAMNRDQAVAMAISLRDRRSAPALGWTATCLPDPSRMPGDEFNATFGGVTARVVATQVVHPLGEGDQTVQLGAAA